MDIVERCLQLAEKSIIQSCSTCKPCEPEKFGFFLPPNLVKYLPENKFHKTQTTSITGGLQLCSRKGCATKWIIVPCEFLDQLQSDNEFWYGTQKLFDKTVVILNKVHKK